MFSRFYGILKQKSGSEKLSIGSKLKLRIRDRIIISLKATRGKKRILMAPCMGGYQQGVFLEGILGFCLILRGYKVDLILCDKLLPACQLTELSSYRQEDFDHLKEQPRCKACYRKGRGILRYLPGVKIIYFSKYLSKTKRDEARNIIENVDYANVNNLTYNGYAVGEHSYAGALRYYARGDLAGEANVEEVVKAYLYAAFLTIFVFEKLLKNNTYEVCCFNHGIYIPQGIIGEVLRGHNIRVVNWNPAYRKKCFIFSHGDTYHKTMISEPTSTWEDLKLNSLLEKKIDDYLKSRWYGSEDWISFHKNPIVSTEKISNDLGIDFNKPCLGLLTNVVWDAQLHYVSNAFPDMMSWVHETIEYFKEKPDIQLIIRVHPAEKNGAIPSRQQVVKEIEKLHKDLPRNIILVPPDSDCSTYALMSKCEAVVIYNTKTGIELSSVGLPVIVAGEAWIRGKGFSVDVTSKEQYLQILEDALNFGALDKNKIFRAKQYAYHFFYRRMIPVDFIESPEKFKYDMSINNYHQLEQGNFSGLDLICNGIIDGSEFVFDEDEISWL